jgi:hypothetical protein
MKISNQTEQHKVFKELKPKNLMRLAVHTVLNIKITVFLDVMTRHFIS